MNNTIAKKPQILPDKKDRQGWHKTFDKPQTKLKHMMNNTERKKKKERDKGENTSKKE